MRLPGRVFLVAAVILVGLAVMTVLLLVRPPTGTLVTANPSQGSSISAPPDTIALTFSSDVTEAHIAVSKATIGQLVITGPTVHQPVRFMATGRHLITYHVVTRIGEQIQGTVAFIVTGNGTTNPAPVQAAPGHVLPSNVAVSPEEAEQADKATATQAPPAEEEDQPDAAILALGTDHDHFGGIDPATAFVLAVNVVILLVIGFLSLRRRIRLARARKS